MTDYKFIGLKQRALMYLFDLMIIAGISYLINSMISHWQASTSFESYLQNYLGYITPFIPGIYFLAFWAWKGASPGKLLRLSKIVDPKTGRKPKFWKLVIRLISLPISNALLLLGIFWMGWDSRKQTWHDKMAGTVVIGPNTIKFPKDADVNYPLPSFVPLFPALPTNRDRKWWIAGRILFVISIFVWIGFLFYTADTRLHPEAEKWLYEPAFIEENPRDNGYYYFVGLAEESDEASFQKGYNFVRENNQYVLKVTQGQPTNIDDYPKQKMSMDWDSGLFNINRDENWLKYCLDYSDSLQKSYERFDFINDRIKLICDLPYYRSTTLPSHISAIPIMMDIVKFVSLEDSYAISLYLKGDKDKGLKILKQNRETMSLLGTKINSLIGKLVVCISLQRNLEAYNVLLSSEHKIPTELRQEINAIKRIDPAIYDMYYVTKRHFREMGSNLIDLFNFQEQIFFDEEYSLTPKQAASSLSIIFQPNRTLNREYDNQRFLYQLSRMSAPKLAKSYKEHPANYTSFTDYFNNLLGTIMSTIAVPVYAQYIAQFHNLDGYANLLKLKLMIKEQNIASEDIPSFLKMHQDSLYNPYTEEAMSWDAEQNELNFWGPFENNSDKRELKVFE